MQSTYSYWLVGLSLAVATLASYTALDLAGRLTALERTTARHSWLAWLVGGAAAMGVGIWSMHFIGMLAFSLPIPLGYNVATTGGSLSIAVLVSLFALWFVTRPQVGHAGLAAAALMMGLGIAGMHYTGMAAMEMHPAIQYDTTLLALSIAIAIGASYAALWIAHTLRDEEGRSADVKRAAAALVMGVAITGMHYTGMAAANFLPGSICGAATDIDARWLATTVTLFTFAILIVTLLLLRFDARTTFLAGVLTDLNGQILRMATLDALTELPNRRTLSEAIERALQTARRERHMLAVLFMDIDGFKTINDSLGHPVGDKVLKAFAHRLARCVGSKATVARLGGDEFVVLLESLPSGDAAQTVAQHVLERMRKGSWDDEQPIQVMPSIGIALYPRDGDSAETLLKNADVAMYEAKRSGRGMYRMFESGMNEAAMRTMQIQRALHIALDADYFLLNFQPKFRGNSGMLTGAEALLRMHHPELGVVAPQEFIPIAERSGQIVQIGQWVLRETCRQIRRWEAAGLPGLKVAINLSPRQLVQPDLVNTMVEIVRNERVRCDQIMFEITESVAMQDAPRTVEMIREFHQYGFEIAIDDFGTGYSSLAYLQRFRVKQLKIDRFFTNGLDEHGREGSAIVQAIIALAHSLEMEVVAEGVETDSQVSMLKGLMCDEMQGFLLGKPLSADAFSALLQDSAGMAQGVATAAPG